MEGLYESKQYLYIVMEMLTGGELFERIVGRPRYAISHEMHVNMEGSDVPDCFLESCGVEQSSLLLFSMSYPLQSVRHLPMLY